jgi:hypothetical protein
MFSVLSYETTTFAEIARFHFLPALSIQPPYKHMPWALYAKNFKRTLARLQLYRQSLDGQDPNRTTTHLRLLSDNLPASSHLQPIADWLDTGSLPPRAEHPPSPTLFPEPSTHPSFSF